LSQQELQSSSPYWDPYDTCINSNSCSAVTAIWIEAAAQPREPHASLPPIRFTPSIPGSASWAGSSPGSGSRKARRPVSLLAYEVRGGIGRHHRELLTARHLLTPFHIACGLASTLRRLHHCGAKLCGTPASSLAYEPSEIFKACPNSRKLSMKGVDHSKVASGVLDVRITGMISHRFTKVVRFQCERRKGEFVSI